MDNNKKKILTGVIIVTLLIAVVGVTYALWSYFQIGKNQSLVAGEIYMKYTESNAVKIENATPSDTYIPENVFEFTIEGKNKYTKPIWYEIIINHGAEHETRKTRLPDKFLNFRLTEQVGGGQEEVVIEEGNYEDFSKGARIWVNTIGAKSEATVIKYKLYIWISNKIKIGNTESGADIDANTWNNDTFASVVVTVKGDFEEKKLPGALTDEIKTQIASHTTESCTPTVVAGDTTYFSGTNDCVNFNYVWYSGKLWRITSINADNTMKMITQDEITVISWGSNATYQGSWIYQWLNEDFLETLENQENIIVQDANWNATETTSTSKPAETTIVEGKVGLLNAYEYTQAYKNISINGNYLNIGYFWWLITPYNSSDVRYVSSNGGLSSNSSSSYVLGVRPSINLKSDIKISGGDGTKENPYRISGDKTVAKVDDKLNSRVSGEYVNFDGKKYRIVGIENETTKLTSVDYVRDADGTVMTKKLSDVNTDVLYGSGTTKNEDNWAGYLNNTWYNSINETYKNMLVQGTYYLGIVGSDSSTGSYKNAICSESNTTERTSECSKISSTWIDGKVGLPRVGEMFSAQLADKQNGSSTSTIWLITPYSSSSVQYVDAAGNLNRNSPLIVYGVHPSINLKSDVVITKGEGTLESPYELSVQ